MQIKELISKFEEKIHPSNQENYDNSGLQLGDVEDELKGIIVTLEITPEVIDLAIKEEVNLIICHHPIIFPYIKKIDNHDFKGKKIIKAIKNNITIYASHSPSDMLGFNEYVFNKLGFISQGKIYKVDENKGYGVYADVNMKVETFIEQMKENLDLENVIVYGTNKEINRVGICTGDGKSFINEVIEKGIDAYITGDITHHFAMDSMEKGLILFDISHEASERYFTYFIENIISEFIHKDFKLIKYNNDEKYLRQIL